MDAGAIDVSRVVYIAGSLGGDADGALVMGWNVGADEGEFVGEEVVGSIVG